MSSKDELNDEVKTSAKLASELEKVKRENAALKAQLEQTKKERIEYLQNVSHQLVAPLNAIKWHIENLTAARVSPERARKVLSSIYSQSTIAVHLAKNFALMSNLEADHSLTALQEPIETVDLYRLMVNLADDFQPLAWDKEVHIKVIPTPLESAPPVLAMKKLISQSFSNIIENAVKYSSKSSDMIISGTHNAKTNTVSVQVSDRGIPLPSDVNLIFERGYRSKEAKSIYPPGTGFGLYIAKRIVEIHEGSISAKTDPSGLVVFTIELSIDKLKGRARERVAKEKDYPDRR
jgi:signal transduction histidine kinase